jgi:hypothetical protein
MTKKAWRLALDFDGVINSYTSGYDMTDSTWLPDAPVPGAKEFIEEALKHFMEVVIVSARARTMAGKKAIMDYMFEHDMPSLPIYYEKVPATIYLDDRAITFTGIFPDVKELANWKSYLNEQERYGRLDYSLKRTT